MAQSATPKVERYGPGQDATDFEPGDFILTHRHEFMSNLISHAEKRRFKGPDAPYAHWSHAALVVGRDGTLAESESRGVERDPISIYHDDEYHLVRLGPGFQADARSRTVAYALSQVGQPFGYLDVLAAFLHLEFGWRLRWVWRNHVICSALVTKALQQGGLVPELDPPLTFPADLAKVFDVRP